MGQRSAQLQIEASDAPLAFGEGATASRSVPENTPSGTDIGDPFTAAVEDGRTLTYTLSGGDAAHFTLDNATGQLRTNLPLDYEARPVYASLTVTVSDGHGLDAELSLTVNVTDVNEAGPKMRPPRNIPANCGAIPIQYGVWDGSDTKREMSAFADTRTANQNDPSHADYLKFGTHIDDEIFMLGQTQTGEFDESKCNGGWDEDLNPVGFPVWNFVFELEDRADILVTPGRVRGSGVPGNPASGAADPAYTLRQFGGYRSPYLPYTEEDGVYADYEKALKEHRNAPWNKYYYARTSDAPVLECPDGEDAPCAAGQQHLGLEPGTYVVTVTTEPPASNPSLVVPEGHFSMNLTYTPAP